MKRIALFFALALLAAPLASRAQSPSPFSNLAYLEASPEGGAGQAASPVKGAPAFVKPFSRIALSGGFSLMGINLQAATNLNRYLNARVTGNVFNYTASNISTNGFNVDAKLNFATAGASLDFYPFPSHGFRLSPGVLFHNTNAASATFTAQGGTSFTLDNYTYYASTTNPVQGIGSFGLHAQNPAFTITTGWGNIIPRKGGHLSFPFELGVALIGSPTVNVALNSGQVCNAQGQYCVDVATDQDVQTNLQAQVAKYKNDLDPLKTYPIISFGMAYSFRVR
jgi:opacity protein-like surface antigen